MLAYTNKELSDLDLLGYTHIPDVFTGELLQKLQSKNLKRWKAFKKSKLYNRYYGTARKRTKFRGSTVMFLADGRYDLELDFGVFLSDKFLKSEKILSIVNPLFKDGYTCYGGSLPS